jgi:hypothetical protein
MMRALVLVAVVVACGKSDTKSSAKPDDRITELGGTVVEVDGHVTARQGDAVLALAVGSRVGADATIETGANGRVVIELAPNHARWELGPNKSQRVRDSIAWKVPASASNANVTIQDNANVEGSAAHATGAKLIEDALAPHQPALRACLGDAPKILLLLDTGPGGLAGFRVKGGTKQAADCVMMVLQNVQMPRVEAHAVVPVEK